MAVASILNSLTRRVDRWVGLEIDANDGILAAILRNGNEYDVRIKLRPLQNAIVHGRQAAPVRASGDDPRHGFVDALERLSKLREDGHLTEEEFQLGKLKLLQDGGG